jgi:Spy/CpxP family protein refolding chaperone
MKRLISLAIVLLMSLPLAAWAGKRHRHRHHRMDPAVAQKVLRDAGLSDQQIRRIETIRNGADRELIDIRHELDKARLEMRQLMQDYNAEEAAILGLVEKMHAIKLRVKKNRVRMKLAIRKEMTPEQFERVREARAEFRMKRREMRRQGRGKGGKGGGWMR